VTFDKVRRMTRLLAPALVVVLAACAGDKDAPAAAKAGEPAAGAAAEAPKPKSNVKKFTSTVPYGKHVACADLVDGAKFGETIGDVVGEVKDKSTTNLDATSVCVFIRGGERPSDAEQQRAFKKNGMKLGVLPGDELCTLTTYCSYPANLEEFKQKCEDQGHREDNTLGLFSCVREYQRADKYAYTYRTIDPETQCTFEVMGGPSVTDEALVQRCMRAALETIGSEHLKKFD
jgi:hypothetical protein